MSAFEYKRTKRVVNQRQDATCLIKYTGEIAKKTFCLEECFGIVTGTWDGEKIEPFSLEEDQMPGTVSFFAEATIGAIERLDYMKMYLVEDEPQIWR